MITFILVWASWVFGVSLGWAIARADIARRLREKASTGRRFAFGGTLYEVRFYVCPSCGHGIAGELCDECQRRFDEECSRKGV